jgi:thiosulfate/3-mercaptopyruvate sulfurtransferase
MESGYAKVRGMIGDTARVLVDVRSPQEYAGEVVAPAGYESEGASRAGHIPTAKSTPWAEAVNDNGTFKNADALRELYGAHGVTPEKETVACCRIGERSAQSSAASPESPILQRSAFARGSMHTPG